MKAEIFKSDASLWVLSGKTEETPGHCLIFIFPKMDYAKRHDFRGVDLYF